MKRGGGCCAASIKTAKTAPLWSALTRIGRPSSRRASFSPANLLASAEEVADDGRVSRPRTALSLVRYSSLREAGADDEWASLRVSGKLGERRIVRIARGLQMWRGASVVLLCASMCGREFARVCDCEAVRGEKKSWLRADKQVPCKVDAFQDVFWTWANYFRILAVYGYLRMRISALLLAILCNLVQKFINQEASI